MKIEKGRKYLVGFAGKSEDAVYSKRAWASYIDHEGGCDKMTFLQPKRHLKTLHGVYAEVAIFKLVPVYKEKITN